MVEQKDLIKEFLILFGCLIALLGFGYEMTLPGFESTLWSGVFLILFFVAINIPVNVVRIKK